MANRNELLYAEYRLGATAAELSAMYGIGKERVYQIINKQERIDAAEVAITEATPDGPVKNYAMALSVRALNCLSNEGIETLRQLEEYTEAELLRVPNFGRKSLNEIAALCKREGVQLGIRSNERWQRRVREQENQIMMKATDDDATQARINVALARYVSRQRERLHQQTWRDRMALVMARAHAADLLSRYVKGDPEAVMQVCETI